MLLCLLWGGLVISSVAGFGNSRRENKFGHGSDLINTDERDAMPALASAELPCFAEDCRCILTATAFVFVAGTTGAGCTSGRFRHCGGFCRTNPTGPGGGVFEGLEHRNLMADGIVGSGFLQHGFGLEAAKVGPVAVETALGGGACAVDGALQLGVVLTVLLRVLGSSAASTRWQRRSRQAAWVTSPARVRSTIPSGW